ncbi:hypothetical protein L1887_04502 [Cichorium endivia]|nr:hypothetical protein L1887_04502 [Cichorium endivia]
MGMMAEEIAKLVGVLFHEKALFVLIVPTGVGGLIGGYVGDALPVARTLASVADCVISHPQCMFVLSQLPQNGNLCLDHLSTAVVFIGDGSFNWVANVNSRGDPDLDPKYSPSTLCQSKRE